SEIEKPVVEFTAIVLAGPGIRLYPLSEPENSPKALNPIAGKPMIWYVLNWLESEGVYDIHIVTIKRDEAPISSYIHEVYDGSAKIVINALDEYYGTAEASDFIVASTDAILDIPRYHYLDLFRLHRPDASCILLQEPPSEGGGGSVREDEVKRYFAIDQQTSDLVYVKDDNTEQDSLMMRMSVLKKHPLLTISNNFLDLHVYVFRQWILEYLNDHTEISSIGYDLIPKLARMKRVPKKRTIPSPGSSHNSALSTSKSAYGIDGPTDSNELNPSYSYTSTKGSSKPGSDVYYRYFNPYQTSFDDYGSINSKFDGDNLYGANKSMFFLQNSSDPSKPISNADLSKLLQVRVFAYVRRGGVGGRANTINRYCDLNKLVSRIYTGNRIGSLAEVSSKSQIAPDSLVGTSTKIKDRCQIKKSVIGAHCSIGNNVKLTNCVIHDYAVIEDNAKLESTVVCRQAKIGSKSFLKECEVGPQASVPSNTTAKSEQFLRSNNEFGTDGVQIKFT
ncbi:hypothetical protein BB560_007327, partial [Smittium megazygosporum]